METRLYDMLSDAGGMNKRWSERGGRRAADFPAGLVVEQSLNREAQ